MKCLWSCICGDGLRMNRGCDLCELVPDNDPIMRTEIDEPTEPADLELGEEVEA